MQLTEATFRVVDFETTGLNEKEAGICEVGWCDVSNNDGVWSYGPAQSQLLDPGHPIPAVAKAVHHIVDSDVEDQPQPADFLPQVFTPGLVFSAHNVEFDRKFASAAGVDTSDPWLCTMRLAKHLVVDAPSYSNQVLRYHLGWDVISGDAHRAGHDVTVTAKLLCHLLSMSKNPNSTVQDVIDYAASPVLLTGKVGFGKHFDKLWSEVPRDYLQWMAKQGSTDWDIDQWHTIQHHLR